MSLGLVSVLRVILSGRKPMRMSLPAALEKGITRCPGVSSTVISPVGSAPGLSRMTGRPLTGSRSRLPLSASRRRA